MSGIDLKDYVAGGYFITKLSTQGFMRTPYFQHEQVISLSSCINPSFKEPVWGWEFEKHKIEISMRGMPEEKLAESRRELEEFQKARGFFRLFFNLSYARRFIKKWVQNPEEIILLGIGLPKNLVQNFLARKLDKQYDLSQDLTRMSVMLQQNTVLSPRGAIKGFEVVSYGYDNFGHSWLCSNLQVDMYDRFGIEAGEHGLLGTYEDAMKVYEWIAEDDEKVHRAEPEPYFPWLIVQYLVN